MKKLLILLLSFAAFNVEATHFQSSMSVTPISNKNEYLVEMHIKKIIDMHSSPELIASPKIICTPGEPAQLTIESEDKADLLSVQVMIPDSSIQNCVHASVLMKEKGQVVLSFDNFINLDSEL